MDGSHRNTCDGVASPLPLSLDRLEALIHVGRVPDACPYLDDRVATFDFAYGHLGPAVYEALLARGYRRNGEYIYKPVCRKCDECRTLRVIVPEFCLSKSQRRTRNRGMRRFHVEIGKPAVSDEKVRLYSAYLRYQHGDSENDLDRAGYERFLVDTCLGGATLELCVYDKDRLAGVGVVDRLENALSSVYFYFDPAYAASSPGVFSALYEIALAREWGLRYYYLGYYIAACPSMAYKAHYRPCEVRRPDATWERRG